MNLLALCAKYHSMIYDPKHTSYTNPGKGSSLKEPLVVLVVPQVKSKPIDLSGQLSSSFDVEGKVLEVLDTFGLAHVRTETGDTYGLNRQTPGIEFGQLHEGQRVRCTVTEKFHRVLHAELLA